MRNEDDTGVRSASPSPGAIDCDTTYKIADDSGDPEQYHRFDPESALAIRAALAARRPLLVRGEPGVGKTQLAAAAAVALGRPLIQKVVNSRTESRDLLWEFDSIMRLADAQIAAHSVMDGSEGSGVGSNGQLPVVNYVKPGPLWWAFDWDGAESSRAHGGADPGSRRGCGSPERMRRPDRRDRQGRIRRAERTSRGPRLLPLHSSRPIRSNRGSGGAAPGRDHDERGARTPQRVRAPLSGPRADAAARRSRAH